MKSLAHIQSQNKNISHIEFGIISNDEIVQQSHVRIYNNNIYDENKNPTEHGLMDLKMGPIDKSICKVCNEEKRSCMGHYGHINLSNYLFPISFLKDIVKILKCICKSCGHILLSAEVLQKYDKVLQKKGLNFIGKKNLRKEIVKLSMKVHQCRFCQSYNGNVKKVKAISMIYHKVCQSKIVLKSFIERFDHLPEDLRTLTNDSIELLRPNYVYSLFKRVPRKHYKYLLVGSDMNLSDLIFKHITVPPNCIRPSTLTNDVNTSREDDITIVQRALLGDLKFPQAHNEYASMIKPSAANLKIKDNKYIRGMLQRLSGKRGRFRYNLMGKRTNFTGRTVISPDPYLRIDQVSIPEFCALKLTFTEMVTSFNIEHLRKCVENGPFIHPGAISHSKLPDNDRHSMSHMKLVNTNLLWSSLKPKKVRETIMKSLEIGDLVERHVDDGDMVLFNRQPSLHRLSFQSFSVVVKKERTLSFNPCCCNPFNADFDGDEMNIHLPQTYEAKAECVTLLSSVKNISSPNRGEPLTAPLQDILTAAYLLTSKDSFYTYSEFLHLASQIFKDLDWNKKILLPKPAILKPIKLFTGKQLINLVISPYRQLSKLTGAYVPDARLNLVAENKIYRNGEDLTHDDSYVVIHNSDLMIGQLDKALLGGGSKLSMFYRILRDVSDEASCRSMERLCKIALTDLKYKGFSIGISDVCPNEKLKKLKAELIENIFNECETYIKSYENNTLDCDPGCSLEETLESKISSKLSNVRDEGGKSCKDELHPRNAPLIMALCGSKGSHINISQMVFCVGQQIIANNRIPNVPGTDRTLLYTPKNCRSPMSKGFVANSFYSGLNPMEFVFHAMSGREGLIDTAVKTAETGYMQRRLIKCLEDLTVQNDGTVRNFSGTLFQYNYGCDGFDPSQLETTNIPCNFVHELYHALQDNSNDGIPLLNIESALQELNIILNKDAYKQNLSGIKESLRENVEFHFKCSVGIMFGISKYQLEVFVRNCYKKYWKAIIEPGTAVGVICGESIGEPATQMTLKTFHFAGVASMNITQGVPRMQEIINGSSNIKTPIITVYPIDDKSESLAKSIQMKIQPIILKELILNSYMFLCSSGKIFEIYLNVAKIEKFGITQEMLIKSLEKFKISFVSIDVVFKDNAKAYIRIISDADYNCQMILNVVEKIQVCGIKNVQRTVVQRSTDLKHTVFMEGGDLISAFQVEGVDTTKTLSNSIIEVMNVLGIEAAKDCIINEFNAVMAAHSLSTDLRHMMLLADTMCHTGQVLGSQRSGMAKSKTSVLCLASFESTLDHLFEAAYHNQKDQINGVSDCITFGKTIPLGTGLSTVIYNVDPEENKKICRKRKFLD